MDASVAQTQIDFYREFLMGRGAFDPHDFGIDMDREEMTDRLADIFNEKFRGQWSIDEMLLHPADALRFCQDVRYALGWFDAPDDIILRPLMTRRKNPNA